MCHVLCVTCHLSHVINANSHSHKPSPWKLPQYAQQNAAAHLDKDSSTMSCKDQKLVFFLRGNFWPFLSQKKFHHAQWDGPIELVFKRSDNNLDPILFSPAITDNWSFLKLCWAIPASTRESKIFTFPVTAGFYNSGRKRWSDQMSFVKAFDSSFKSLVYDANISL